MRVALATILILTITGHLAASEPSLGELQRAAVRMSHADPERAARAADRARSSGLLPSIRLRVARDIDRDESLDLEPGTADQLGLDASERLVLEIRAEWELGRLLYDPNELQALESASRLARERRDVLTSVTQAYFERRRILSRLAAAGAADDEERLSELTALVDALTGGALSRQQRADEARRTTSGSRRSRTTDGRGAR